MSAGIRLTHVGLCVRDLDQSCEFYCDALGFEEIARMHIEDSATAKLLDPKDCRPDEVCHVIE